MQDQSIGSLTESEMLFLLEGADEMGRTADEILALALEKAASGADRRRKKRAQVIQMRLDRAAKKPAP